MAKDRTNIVNSSNNNNDEKQKNLQLLQKTYLNLNEENTNIIISILEKDISLIFRKFDNKISILEDIFKINSEQETLFKKQILEVILKSKINNQLDVITTQFYVTKLEEKFTLHLDNDFASDEDKQLNFDLVLMLLENKEFHQRIYESKNKELINKFIKIAYHDNILFHYAGLDSTKSNSFYTSDFINSLIGDLNKETNEEYSAVERSKFKIIKEIFDHNIDSEYKFIESYKSNNTEKDQNSSNFLIKNNLNFVVKLYSKILVEKKDDIENFYKFRNFVEEHSKVFSYEGSLVSYALKNKDFVLANKLIENPHFFKIINDFSRGCKITLYKDAIFNFNSDFFNSIKEQEGIPFVSLFEADSVEFNNFYNKRSPLDKRHYKFVPHTAIIEFTPQEIQKISPKCVGALIKALSDIHHDYLYEYNSEKQHYLRAALYRDKKNHGPSEEFIQLAKLKKATAEIVHLLKAIYSNYLEDKTNSIDLKLDNSTELNVAYLVYKSYIKNSPNLISEYFKNIENKSKETAIKLAIDIYLKQTKNLIKIAQATKSNFIKSSYYKNVISRKFIDYYKTLTNEQDQINILEYVLEKFDQCASEIYQPKNSSLIFKESFYDFSINLFKEPELSVNFVKLLMKNKFNGLKVTFDIKQKLDQSINSENQSIKMLEVLRAEFDNFSKIGFKSHYYHEYFTPYIVLEKLGYKFVNKIIHYYINSEEFDKSSENFNLIIKILKYTKNGEKPFLDGFISGLDNIADVTTLLNSYKLLKEVEKSSELEKENNATLSEKYPNLFKQAIKVYIKDFKNSKKSIYEIIKTLKDGTEVDKIEINDLFKHFMDLMSDITFPKALFTEELCADFFSNELINVNIEQCSIEKLISLAINNNINLIEHIVKHPSFKLENVKNFYNTIFKNIIDIYANGDLNQSAQNKEQLFNKHYKLVQNLSAQIKFGLDHDILERIFISQLPGAQKLKLIDLILSHDNEVKREHFKDIEDSDFGNYEDQLKESYKEVEKSKDNPKEIVSKYNTFINWLKLSLKYLIPSEILSLSRELPKGVKALFKNFNEKFLEYIDSNNSDINSSLDKNDEENKLDSSEMKAITLDTKEIIQGAKSINERQESINNMKKFIDTIMHDEKFANLDGKEDKLKNLNKQLKSLLDTQEKEITKLINQAENKSNSEEQETDFGGTFVKCYQLINQRTRFLDEINCGKKFDIENMENFLKAIEADLNSKRNKQDKKIDELVVEYQITFEDLFPDVKIDDIAIDSNIDLIGE